MHRSAPLLLLFLSAHALAQTSTLTTNQAINQTPSQTSDAQQAVQNMQGMTAEQQQAFAKDWAQKHRTAFAATAVRNSAGVNQAYAFRNHMGGDAQCQGYAQQADDIYLSSTLDQESKQEKLAQLGKQAGAANCMQ